MDSESVTPNVEVMPMPIGNNLATVDRAEIDMQISTAKQYPRSVSVCLDNARAIIKTDKASAQQAFYLLDFYDKSNPIIGPSIRMAEILASQWKNIRYGSRPLEVTENTVVAQGYCYDLENNVAFTATKTRPIRKKNGDRFKEHDIIKTMLGAQAIAERDAILKVIPRAFANNLVEEAMNVADGGEKSVAERQADWVSFWAGKGVSCERLCSWLGISDKRDMTLRHFQVLRALANSVKDGITTIDDAFAVPTTAGHKVETASVDLESVTPTAEQPADSGHKSDDAPKPADEAPQRRDEFLFAIQQRIDAGGIMDMDALCGKAGIKSATEWAKASIKQLEALYTLITEPTHA